MFQRTLKSSARLVVALLLAFVGQSVVELTPPAAAASIGGVFQHPTITPAKKPTSFSFDLVTSAGAAACLPDLRGEVRITQRGENQEMDVFVSGLPANTTFTVFVLQLPHAPFGMSWYQGDIETNQHGDGRASFVGIFSDETFVMAPGVGPAPVVHPADANVNPQTAPVHTFHLGMWFDSKEDAVAAGCAGGQTPFNGEHAAGIQVLNTTNFPDADGPIGQSGL